MKKVINEVWEEKTIHFKITLKGFDTIHCLKNSVVFIHGSGDSN